MEWLDFALGFTSCGFLLSMVFIWWAAREEDDDIFSDIKIHGPFSLEEAMEDLKKVDKEVKKDTKEIKETKDAKGKKSTKVSEIKPKS